MRSISCALAFVAMVVPAHAGAPGNAPDPGVTLILTSGRTVTFRDLTDGCPDQSNGFKLDHERCVRNTLQQDYQREGFVLVRRSRYESASWLLVNKTSGRVTALDEIPLFSPDGSRFLIINNDVANDHPYQIAIWRRVDDGAAIEFQWTYRDSREQIAAMPPFTHTELMPGNWSGNERVEFSFHGSGLFKPAAGKATALDVSWQASLVRQNGAWKLQTEWPKSDATR